MVELHESLFCGRSEYDIISMKYYNSFPRSNTLEPFQLQKKCVCFYAYFEKNNMYRENFQHFLIYGLLNTVTYYIIVNGKCTVDIPKRENIHVLYRKNKGYDFGAYSHAIQHVQEQYDYYFFMNTSVRGPFRTDRPWTIPFLELFNDGENIQLVGLTINIFPLSTFTKKYNLQKMFRKNPPFSHVQSMFFCMKPELFQYLQTIHFFDEKKINRMKSIEKVIAEKEIALSQMTLQNGWNINCLLPGYRGQNYRTLAYEINTSSNDGDPWYKDGYYGRSITVDDLNFMKTNRSL